MAIEIARDCHVHYYLPSRRAWAGGRDERDPTTTSNLVAIFGMMMCPPRVIFASVSISATERFVC